jgi:hypothetical protein
MERKIRMDEGKYEWRKDGRRGLESLKTVRVHVLLDCDVIV